MWRWESGREGGRLGECIPRVELFVGDAELDSERAEMYNAPDRCI
jgi:hypothetical protein